MRISTRDIIERYSLNAETYCEEGSEPERTRVRFSDVLPELREGGPRCRSLSSQYLYAHQLETLRALEEGKNVVLISGTGSGKTEAWVIHALTTRKKVLAIYPTLALSRDQIRRIKEYYNAIDTSHHVVIIDAPECKRLGRDEVRRRTRSASIVITNPAFLLNDLKRASVDLHSSVLAEFMGSVDIIVVDELDFYGSHGASLIVAMIEIIAKFLRMSKTTPQVVVLTATLGNPKEFANILENITGRPTKVIHGKPFKLKNCVYVVLGKDLEKLRERLLGLTRGTRFFKRYREWLEDPELFHRNAHILVKEARRYGINVSIPYFDPAEILSEYLQDDVVTVVFAPSIRVVDKLVRRIRSLLPPNLQSLIQPHHHLVPKDTRTKIEKDAAYIPPKVKVIVTVRTLLQGIDLPTIGRVVHYGLPVETREYWQREGRKGRRKEIGETETVIMPVSPWDREILALGKDGIRSFEELSLEKVYVISENKYAKLFTALYKLFANTGLGDDDIELLNELKLLDWVSGRPYPNEKAIKIWRYLNFYEFGPPYGIRRFLKKNSGYVELEQSSRRDLVERYQVGMIDYSENSFVVKSGFDRIIEEPIDNVLRNPPSWLSEIIPHYEAIKAKWGEKPDLRMDILTGRLTSYVEIALHIPSEGFGILRETPLRVLWTIESRNRYKVVKAGKTILQLFEKANLEINSDVAGSYTDLTYGIVKQLDPDTSIDKLKLAAAALMLVLRIHPKYRISFRELRITVFKPVAGAPTVVMWEPEASGVLNIIDWERLISELSSLKPPGVWIQLIGMLDPAARDYLLTNSLKWSDVMKLCASLIRKVSGVELTSIKGIQAWIPKPSRKLNIYAVEVVPVGKDEFVVGVFDGESIDIKRIKETGVPRAVRQWLVSILEKAVDENAFIVTASKLEEYAFGRTASLLLDELVRNNRLINPFEKLKEVIGEEFIDVEEIARVMGIKARTSTIFQRGSGSQQEFKEGDAEFNMKFLLKITYGAYLLYKALLQEN